MVDYFNPHGRAWQHRQIDPARGLRKGCSPQCRAQLLRQMVDGIANRLEKKSSSPIFHLGSQEISDGRIGGQQ